MIKSTVDSTDRSSRWIVAPASFPFGSATALPFPSGEVERILEVRPKVVEAYEKNFEKRPGHWRRRNEPMIHVLTGWKVSVESTEAGGSYVIVSALQADALRRPLTEHCIPHAVEAEVPSRQHAEAPAELVVRLRRAVEVAQVQDILDLAP